VEDIKTSVGERNAITGTTPIDNLLLQFVARENLRM
jgi:hypothetical protein